MEACLFVGLGGFVGAAGRYLLSLLPISREFPFATLLANFLGAVAIGFLAAMAETVFPAMSNLLLFLKTGVCGGFTTFSTFSLEAFDFFEKEKPIWGIAYVVLSVLLCLGGVFLGKQLGRLAGRRI